MQFIAIEEDGALSGFDGPRTEVLTEVIAMTLALYSRVGYQPPWTSYLAVEDGAALGSCSFTSAPVEGSVEIAYYTFPGNEGRGVATEMATHLIDMTSSRSEIVDVIAFTLPARNASHRILEKLGFESMGNVEHPEDGTILKWRLKRP